MSTAEQIICNQRYPMSRRSYLCKSMMIIQLDRCELLVESDSYEKVLDLCVLLSLTV